MKVGVNSFCIKTKLTQDFDGTLQRLKDGGLAFLEPCITFSEHEIASEPYAEQMKLTGGGIWPVQAAADHSKAHCRSMCLHATAPQTSPDRPVPHA